MKILIIGGKGTIGKKVSEYFAKKHEIVIGGRKSGDVIVDIADSKSIEAMYRIRWKCGCSCLHRWRSEMGSL